MAVIGRPIGIPMTDEQKQFLSDYWKKRGRPENKTKLKGNQNAKGHKKTEERIESIRKQMLGNTYRRGTKLTEEHKRKCSEKLRGRIVVTTEAMIISAKKRSGPNHYQYGKKLPKETITKLSIALSGSKNPNWRGGISTLPYCIEWNCIKEYIKERDGHVCLNPFCKKIHKKIFVHHINYTKSICGTDNLISLCNSCNSRANFNREKWKQLYRFIMNNYYGYQYGY
jgi:hypothetical protein